MKICQTHYRASRNLSLQKSIHHTSRNARSYTQHSITCYVIKREKGKFYFAKTFHINMFVKCDDEQPIPRERLGLFVLILGFRNQKVTCIVFALFLQHLKHPAQSSNLMKLFPPHKFASYRTMHEAIKWLQNTNSPSLHL